MMSDDKTQDQTTETPPDADPIPETPGSSGGSPEDPGNTQTPPPDKQAYIQYAVMALKECQQQILTENKELTARDDITEEEWRKYAEELYNIEYTPDQDNSHAYQEKVSEIMQRTIPGMSSAYGISAENTPISDENTSLGASLLKTQATGDLFNDLVSLIGELFSKRMKLLEEELERKRQRQRTDEQEATLDHSATVAATADNLEKARVEQQGAKDGDAPQTQPQETDPNLLAYMYRNGRGGMG